MARVGSRGHTFEVIRNFLKMPYGEAFGLVSRVSVDSNDRIYVFQRKDPPVVVFDCEGNTSAPGAAVRSRTRTA